MAPTPSLGAPSNATTIKVGAALGTNGDLPNLRQAIERKPRKVYSHQSQKEYHSEKPWGAPVELGRTSVPAELVGTVVEEPGPGIYVPKPELEGTAGIYGLRGVYIKKKSELDAESRARDADRVDS
ncbi:hypothetical protein F5X98DRAFT_372346 [Xylaria grammica]|nr:hypothetical protein F5X98DRAFT_372346 [Xylaria grammica]